MNISLAKYDIIVRLCTPSFPCRRGIAGARARLTLSDAE